MRPLALVPLLLAGAACAPKVFTLRTQHTAALSVASRSAELACEVPARHAYGSVQRVTEKRDGAFAEVEAREVWAPLPVRILNGTASPGACGCSPPAPRRTAAARVRGRTTGPRRR